MLKRTLKSVNLETRSLIELHFHHFSHETIGAQFLIVVRVERGSDGFLEDLPKIGFKIETMVMMISE